MEHSDTGFKFSITIKFYIFKTFFALYFKKYSKISILDLKKIGFSFKFYFMFKVPQF